MKKILVTAVIILVTAHVNAQTGMPQALTCTERAFNFSFSVGTKWKLVAPKMGPVEVTRSGPDCIPAWSLKLNNLMPETHLLPVVEKPFNVAALGYPVNRQNYVPLFYFNNFGIMGNPTCLLSGIKPGQSIIYKVVWPNFLVNSSSYGP
jgi:hypothetical protein